MTARHVALTGLLLVAAVLGGCGVTPDDTPRAIDPPRGPFQAIASPTPATTANGAVPQTLYLIRNDKLVAVTRQLDPRPSLDRLVAALVAGPTDRERDQGITSALLGSKVVTTVHATAGHATVELAPAVDGAPRTDEVLAYAQLVCTLTTRADITGVVFTRDGRPTAVPRADGSLSQGPLTTADYAPLLR